MDALERYLAAVRRNLFTSREDAARLEADLRAHFAAAEADGEAPARILDDLGPPEEVAAAFNAEREIRYAGFWLRFVAFIGDFGALVALCLPAAALAVWWSTRAMPSGAPPIAKTLAIGALGIAVTGILTLYFPLLEARFGKTLGKHLMRIRVVRESGAPIGFGQALVRRLSLYFELLVVDALFIPFTDRRQRALDIIAKTIVAREPGEEATAWGYLLCFGLPIVAMATLAAVVAFCAPA